MSLGVLEPNAAFRENDPCRDLTPFSGVFDIPLDCAFCGDATCIGSPGGEKLENRGEGLTVLLAPASRSSPQSTPSAPSSRSCSPISTSMHIAGLKRGDVNMCVDTLTGDLEGVGDLKIGELGHLGTARDEDAPCVGFISPPRGVRAFVSAKGGVTNDEFMEGE